MLCAKFESGPVVLEEKMIILKTDRQTCTETWDFIRLDENILYFD